MWTTPRAVCTSKRSSNNKTACKSHPHIWLKRFKWNRLVDASFCSRTCECMRDVHTFWHSCKTQSTMAKWYRDSRPPFPLHIFRIANASRKPSPRPDCPNRQHDSMVKQKRILRHWKQATSILYCVTIHCLLHWSPCIVFPSSRLRWFYSAWVRWARLPRRHQEPSAA